MNHSNAACRAFTALIVTVGLWLSTNPFLKADTVTMNSGEVIVGEICSETDTQIEIVTTNAKRTISSKRLIPKADIKTFTHETAEQKREKADYETLTQYKLDPNQELTKAQYAAGISAFQGFLTEHPKSIFATELSNRIAAWQAELSNVEVSQVKFADKWMTPVEKAVQYSEWRKNQQIQLALDTVKSLQKKLTDLQQRRKKTAAALVAAQGDLAETQSKLASLQDIQVPIYRTVTIPGSSSSDSRGRVVVSGQAATTRQEATGQYTTTPNPERPRLTNRVTSLQGDIAQLQTSLTVLDPNIQNMQIQIQNAQEAYQLAQNKTPLTIDDIRALDAAGVKDAAINDYIRKSPIAAPAQNPTQGQVQAQVQAQQPQTQTVSTPQKAADLIAEEPSLARGHLVAAAPMMLALNKWAWITIGGIAALFILLFGRRWLG